MPPKVTTRGVWATGLDHTAERAILLHREGFRDYRECATSHTEFGERPDAVPVRSQIAFGAWACGVLPPKVFSGDTVTAQSVRRHPYAPVLESKN